jgi:ferredoxin
MIAKKVLFYFPKSETEKPIVYDLIKRYNLMINIFRAKVTPDEEGYLLVDVSGTEQDYQAACDYLRGFGVVIREDVMGIRWLEARCTSCGNCVPHCPTRALDIPDRTGMAVRFDGTKCIECMSCVAECPFAACLEPF